MDEQTTLSYSKKAHLYSDDWFQQPEPKDMYQLFQKFFHPKGATVDIGCGNGRDAAWLSQNGYPVEGFDASLELIEIAKARFPKILFQQSFLPALKEIQKQYDNVICETVIMHLPKSEIPEALQNLKRILKPEGVLYLSWRVTEDKDSRLPDGRLYSSFKPEFVLDHLNDLQNLHFEDKQSASSGKRVCRAIYRNL